MRLGRFTLPIARRLQPLRMAVLASLLPLGVTACSDMGLPGNALSTSSLTPQETNLDCVQLTRIIQSEIARVKSMPTTAYAQQSQPAVTLDAMWTRMTGPAGSDLPIMKDYTHSRARLRAFGAQHAANCRPTIDVDAELAETDRVMATASWGQGTAREARALLDKSLAAFKANREQALAQAKAGGFRDRDLYVSCASAVDGAMAADPVVMSANLRDLKDSAGRNYGAEMLAIAREGTVAEVSYVLSPPGSGAPPRDRIALVTRVGDHVCSVSHWR